MKRLFIAVEPPDRVKAEIYDGLMPILREYVDGSFIPAEKMHITLLFLGDSDIPETEIIERLDSIKIESEIYLRKIGGFPSLDQPRVVFMDAVDSLQTVHFRLKSLFPIREDQAYSPHLTLCRVKKKLKDLEDINARIGSLDIHFRATELRLFKSDMKNYKRLY